MKTATDITFLSQFPLIQLLNEDEQQLFFTMVERQTKPKYSFVYRKNEPSDTIYFLAKGTVKIATHSTDGKEVIKSLIHPMAMLGELGLIGEKSRQDYAQVLKQEVTVFSIKVHDFKKLMRSNYELCDAVMSSFGKRLMRAENKLESLIFKDARTRIIDFIKDAINTRGRKVGYEMLLKHQLTHQDIANITCTSRQTVTLVLNELKKSDLIYFNRGKILVRDMTKLI